MELQIREAHTSTEFSTINSPSPAKVLSPGLTELKWRSEDKIPEFIESLGSTSQWQGASTIDDQHYFPKRPRNTMRVVSDVSGVVEIMKGRSADLIADPGKEVQALIAEATCGRFLAFSLSGAKSRSSRGQKDPPHEGGMPGRSKAGDVLRGLWKAEALCI